MNGYIVGPRLALAIAVGAVAMVVVEAMLLGYALSLVIR